MADVSFSGSTASAAVVQASGVTRVQAPQLDAAAQSTASAARNIADSVALSVEAMQATAVTAAQKSGNSNAKAVQQSPEQQQAQSAVEHARLTANIEQSLTKMAGDVSNLMRMFGLNSQEAAEVETKFSHSIAEKVGQPPEASLGMRAYVPFYNGEMALEARNIDISIQQTASGEFDFTVGLGNIGVVSPQTAVTNTYNDLTVQSYTTPDSVNVSITPDSNGVIIDQSGNGTREIASVLTGDTRAVVRTGDEPEKSAAEKLAEMQGGEEGGPTVAQERFGQAQAMDQNQDGQADQTDSGFNSLLVMRSGEGMPMVEGGTMRVQFDAVIPVQDRYDFATISAADQATAPSQQRVTEPSADGYDVSV